MEALPSAFCCGIEGQGQIHVLNNLNSSHDWYILAHNSRTKNDLHSLSLLQKIWVYNESDLSLIFSKLILLN